MLAFPAFRRISISLIRLYTALTDGSGRALLRPPNEPEDSDSGLNCVSDMDEFVTIATFDKTTDAHIAMGRLAVEGIQALLFDDNMVQMDWLYAIALGGIKLRVALADETAARRILATDYSSDLDGVDLGRPET